jgi:hypothetical protein
VVVVDEANNWLAYNLGHNVRDALRLAKKATEYDPTATLIAYKVVEEVELKPKESE